MEIDWRERMEAESQASQHYANASLATGSCTDEGDEFSPAVIEYSRLAALDLARTGLYGDFARDCANSRNIKTQMLIADWFFAKPKESQIKARIVKVVRDVTERQLGKAEFFTRREAGAAEIMATEVMLRDAAEKEWMQREAERETGFKRDDPNPARREICRKKYRALCNRGRKVTLPATQTPPA